MRLPKETTDSTGPRIRSPSDPLFRDNLLRNINSFLPLRDQIRMRRVSRGFSQDRQDYVYLDHNTEDVVLPLLEDEKFDRPIIVHPDYYQGRSRIFTTPISERALWNIIANTDLDYYFNRGILFELALLNGYPDLVHYLAPITYDQFGDVEVMRDIPVQLYIQGLENARVFEDDLHYYISQGLEFGLPQLVYYIMSRPDFTPDVIRRVKQIYHRYDEEDIQDIIEQVGDDRLVQIFFGDFVDVNDFGSESGSDYKSENGSDYKSDDGTLYLDYSTQDFILPLLQDENFDRTIRVDPYHFQSNETLLSVPISERALLAILENIDLDYDFVRSMFLDLALRNGYPHLLQYLGPLRYEYFGEGAPILEVPIEVYIEGLRHSQLDPNELYNFIVEGIVFSRPELVYYIMSRPDFRPEMIDMAREFVLNDYTYPDELPQLMDDLGPELRQIIFPDL